MPIYSIASFKYPHMIVWYHQSTVFGQPLAGNKNCDSANRNTVQPVRLCQSSAVSGWCDRLARQFYELHILLSTFRLCKLPSAPADLTETSNILIKTVESVPVVCHNAITTEFLICMALAFFYISSLYSNIECKGGSFFNSYFVLL